MSATSPSARPLTSGELRWDPIVIDLTATDLMVELDPPLVLTAGR